MIKKTFFMLAIWMFFITPSSFAEKIAVIVNAANSQSLTNKDIKNIYSDNITTWKNGKKINSYDLPLKSTEREQYAQKILGMSAKESARMWANKKITNSAKNPPRTKPERLIVSFVAKDPQAIGYVKESAAKGNDKIRIVLTVD